MRLFTLIFDRHTVIYKVATVFAYVPITKNGYSVLRNFKVSYIKGPLSNIVLFNDSFAENITNELTIKLHMAWR
jgi:hypothetical protein